MLKDTRYNIHYDSIFVSRKQNKLSSCTHNLVKPLFKDKGSKYYPKVRIVVIFGVGWGKESHKG